MSDRGGEGGQEAQVRYPVVNGGCRSRTVEGLQAVEGSVLKESFVRQADVVVTTIVVLGIANTASVVAVPLVDTQIAIDARGERIAGGLSARCTGLDRHSSRGLGFLRRARPGITSGVAGVNQKSHQVNGKCLETVAGTQS